jgi:hypothetical protein
VFRPRAYTDRHSRTRPTGWPPPLFSGTSSPISEEFRAVFRGRESRLPRPQRTMIGREMTTDTPLLTGDKRVLSPARASRSDPVN